MLSLFKKEVFGSGAKVQVAGEGEEGDEEELQECEERAACGGGGDEGF